MLNNDRLKKKALGLAIGERALLVAEVAADGKGAKVLRVCEFTFPAGQSFERADALGEALAIFLAEKGFTTRSAIIGVPARWLTIKSHDLPAADAHAAASMLALNTEAQRTPELGEMVYDFSGQTSTVQPTSVLVMGLPRRWLDRLKVLADSAGLKTLSITPCTAALEAASAIDGDNSFVLSLRPGGSELAASEGRQTRMLRHLGSTSAIPPLVAEVSRATAGMPNGAASGNGYRPSVGGSWQRRLVIWDDMGLPPGAIESLQSALGMDVVRGTLSDLGGTGSGLADGRVGAAAIALTLPALVGKRPAVDFLHPRIKISVPKKDGRRVAWLWAAGAAAVVIGTLCYADLARLESQVTQRTNDLRKLDPRLKLAKPFVAAMQFVRGFDSRDPRHLACVRDVTQLVPPDGQTYLTSFHLQTIMKNELGGRATRELDDAHMKGEFSGRAVSDKEVITLVDKLKAAKRFVGINSKLDTHDTRGAGPAVSFTVTFLYVTGR